MVLYHGSNIGNIEVLRPNQADHDQPYVYMTTIDVVAAFYLCNAVKSPYYWFPYGFEGDSEIPIYHELYPNALQEVSEGVGGYIYEVHAGEEKVIPFKNIPCARLATEPIAVTKCVRIENAYVLFLSGKSCRKHGKGMWHRKTGNKKETLRCQGFLFSMRKMGLERKS